AGHHAGEGDTMVHSRSRAASTLAAFAAISLVACSDDTSTPANDDVLLEPPPPGHGTQLSITTNIEAGVQAAPSHFLTAPKEELTLKHDEVSYAEGSHHVLLYETPYEDIPTRKEDGTRVDTSGVFDCSDGATNGWKVKRLIGGSQNRTGESVLSFPSD